MSLKCVAISDSHGRHDDIVLPKNIDILFHSGDFCNWGIEEEAIEFLQWFKKQDARYKVFIAGNHDKCFEKYEKYDILKETLGDCSNVYYLEDSEVTIEGHKIYGSPWTPEFGYGWAFNAKRGANIKEHWDKIPLGTDVLITHGPPRGMQDLLLPRLVRENENPHVGCDDLMNAVNIIKPKFHIFGHIHCGYGQYLGVETTFLNAAVCDERYDPSNYPHEFTL